MHKTTKMEVTALVTTSVAEDITGSDENDSVIPQPTQGKSNMSSCNTLSRCDLLGGLYILIDYGDLNN